MIRCCGALRTMLPLPQQFSKWTRHNLRLRDFPFQALSHHRHFFHSSYYYHHQIGSNSCRTSEGASVQSNESAFATELALDHKGVSYYVGCIAVPFFNSNFLCCSKKTRVWRWVCIRTQHIKKYVCFVQYILHNM